MPRRGENIYKRKDGRWEGRYIADRKPDGKAIYRSIYGTSYAQVREKLVAKRQETQKRQIGSCKLTVNELLALWQAENSQIKPTSRERYRALIELHIQPELGARKVRELNEEVLDAFVRKKLRSGRAGRQGRISAQNRAGYLHCHEVGAEAGKTEIQIFGGWRNKCSCHQAEASGGLFPAGKSANHRRRTQKAGQE